jgi:hypothetical protein
MIKIFPGRITLPVVLILTMLVSCKAVIPAERSSQDPPRLKFIEFYSPF